MSGEEDTIPYTVTYLDGPLERGEWIHRAGLARVVYSNGDVYEGLFNEAKNRHGEGVYTWKMEEGEARFEGTYKNGVRQGYGVVTLPNGEEYKGLWSNDKRSGQGTYTYANGDLYSGSWRADRKHGNGAYVFANKAQISGEWRNGELVRGKWIMNDYSSYHGNFKNGKPIGNCIFVHDNGNIQQGQFVEESKEDVEEGEELARKFVAGQIDVLRGKAKDYAAPCTSELPAEDFILPLPKDKSPLYQEQEELTKLFNDIIAAQEAANPESPEVEGASDPSEQKEEQPEVAEEKGPEPKVSIQDMAELLQKVAEGEEQAVYGNILSSVPEFASGELHSFVKELDKDNDGMISEEELKFYFYLVKLFHLCDQDQSGQIKHAELLVAMRDHADKFPEGFVEGDATRVGVSARLSTGDRDNDRLLTFGEFAHMTMFLNPQE